MAVAAGLPSPPAVLCLLVVLAASRLGHVSPTDTGHCPPHTSYPFLGAFNSQAPISS